MSTYDVPGAVAAHRDVLAAGCWAEHADGSLLYVEGTEAARVVYSLFDLAHDPPVEYRDAMPVAGFEKAFSWPNDVGLQWTWHDKTPFPWDRVMRQFPAGQKSVSADDTLTAAARVAEALQLRAGVVRARQAERPTVQRGARAIMLGIREVVEAVRRQNG